MCFKILFSALLYIFIVSTTVIIATTETCSFSDQCVCSDDSGKMSVYCPVQTYFPTFAPSDMVISTMLITGQFTVINDNAFYPLAGLTNADVTVQSTKNISSTLVTFPNTFSTQTPTGLNALYFSGYNPVDLYEMPSNNHLSSLSVQNANLVSVIYPIDNFPDLLSIDYSHNRLTVVSPSIFNLYPLQKIWLEYNNLTVVDSGFEAWLQVNSSNMLSLAFNPIQCNSNAQWMANYAVCKPMQIGLYEIYCPTGETILKYLTPYANLCYTSVQTTTSAA